MPANRKTTPTQGMSLPYRVAGTLLLVIALIDSGIMSAKHVWSLTLPGCGQGGGCEWASNGPWSSLLGFPVAYGGLAFFASLLALWLLTSRSGIWKPLVLMTRLGMLGSLLFLTVMLVTGHFCPWCFGVHLANLAWWISLEIMSRRVTVVRLTKFTKPLIGLAVFLLVAAASKGLELQQRSVAQHEAQTAAEESIAQIGQPGSVSAESPTASSPETQPIQARLKPITTRFGGRFWTASPDAKVRVVLFQDYQCKLCKEAESTLAGLIATRADVSLSVKHWPFDQDCNKLILGESMHPGSCFDARCAEAVGMIGGKELFWAFHNWLFARGGAVKLPEIRQEVSKLGLDLARFDQTVNDPAVDSILANDIADGVKYGIKFTPMIFVNGYEVRGWQSAGALPAAIDRAAQMAQQQPKQNDLPALAIDQQFQDWMNSDGYSLAIGPDDHIQGAISAPTAILMYGDITEPFNVEASHILEKLIVDTQKVVFIFRTFPLQSDCNDMVKRAISPRACEAARVLEASFLVGGEQAFRKARLWFVKNSAQLPPSLIAPVASACNIAPEALAKAIDDPRIAARIGAYVESAKQLGVDTSPTIFVNGKRARDWRTPGLLERIIAATTSRAYRRPGQ